jgi:ABC-type sugar transport system ATPase subunit
MRAIFGIDKKTSGTVYFAGKRIAINNPRDAIVAGFGLVPEDRKLEGLNLDGSVKDNMSLPIIRKISRLSFISAKKEVRLVRDYIAKFGIKVSSVTRAVDNLSGGNQQKVVISKWLMTEPRMLLLDEPTKGVDVGSKQEIYNLIKEMARSGICIILSTSDLEEIIELSDRIVVLNEGKIRGEVNKNEATPEIILRIASFGEGKRSEGSAAMMDLLK